MEGTPIERVCDVDFAVTQPYLAQKSSFGLTPKSTTIPLQGYKMLDGTELIKSTDLADIMVLNGSDYNATSQVNTMLDAFITKYDKLAITVPKSALAGTPLASFEGTIKMIPKQQIYIFEGNGNTFTMQNISSFKAPFTIVTKNINLIISGNVDYNGMFLVKNGTIEFAPQASAHDRCPTPQVVKGIFVATNGFVQHENLTNTETNNLRCSYGNLQVKGILIGKGLDNIVANRRSVLNHRFTVGSSADTIVKSERRNEIFNGAAVLIEYSPSLWSALPPGASEFTKALDVYKQ